ncbi:MAG: hydroxyethylthiazole kinase [Pseudomonadota bacterium]
MPAEELDGDGPCAPLCAVTARSRAFTMLSADAAHLDGATGSLVGAVADAVDRLRARPPRIHALMAPVAQPLGANIAAALGIDVSMTVHPDDVAGMAAGSDCILVNLGMLDPDRRAGSLCAAKSGRPFVLDPVKVDRAPGRLAFARELMALGPVALKANHAEMRALQPNRAVASLETGACDVVRDGARRVEIMSGTPMLARVIATGCATGLLVSALVAVSEDAFTACVAAAALMGVAGEMAEEKAAGPGTFAAHLIDAVAALDGAAVARRMAIREVAT